MMRILDSSISALGVVAQLAESRNVLSLIVTKGFSARETKGPLMAGCVHGVCSRMDS